MSQQERVDEIEAGIGSSVSTFAIDDEINDVRNAFDRVVEESRANEERRVPEAGVNERDKEPLLNDRVVARLWG